MSKRTHKQPHWKSKTDQEISNIRGERGIYN